MTTPWIGRKLARTSAVDLWKWVSQPRLEWAKAVTPPAVSSVTAISKLFPEVSSECIDTHLLEFLKNSKLFEEVNRRMIEKRHRRLRSPYWAEFLYIATRILQPAVIFETGVFDGESSAVLLQALDDNGRGTLVSVDLPAVATADSSPKEMVEAYLPPNCDPGWLVPDYLRRHWRLLLGDSRLLLPKLFEEYPTVDVFFHDSLHTFEHQYFEYSLAWPHLRSGGLLLSDDILWSHAFHKICREKRRSYVNLYRGSFQGGTMEGFGVTRK